MPGRRTHTGTDWTIRQRLELFRRRCAQLRDRRVVKDGITFTFSLVIDGQQRRLVPRFTGPDEEDFRALMLDFRHFIAKDEPVNYERIVSDCYRSIDEAHPDASEVSGLRDRLQAARTSWREIMRYKPSTGPTVDGVGVSAEILLDLWINGDYFHSDEQKARQLDKLLETRGPVTRARLIRAVQSMVKNLVCLDAIIKMGLERELFRFPDE